MSEIHKKLKTQAQFIKRQRSTILPDSSSVLAHIHKEKQIDRYTIKNIVMNVKLKTRVSKLLNSLSPSRRFKNLTSYLLKKINDKSYYYMNLSKAKENCQIAIVEDSCQQEEAQNKFASKKLYQSEKKKSTKRVLIDSLKRMIESIPIINPNSLYKLLWDSLLSVIIVLLIAVAPMKLAVQDYCISYYLGSQVSLMIIIILIVIDIIINLNTAFFRYGKIEVNRGQIVNNYLNQVGIFDILITQCLLYEIIQTQYLDIAELLPHSFKNNWFYQFQHILLLILLYIKSAKLYIFFKIEETFSFKRRTVNILSLVKLLFLILKVAHAFACLWLFIGRANKEESWLKDIKEGWMVEYIKAYYFITVTMTTIGYGDIVPTNVIETIVSIFSMIIACGIFGYTINSIGSIFLELKKEGEEKQENLFIINRYMSEKNISRDLQSSIREYLEYYWSQWKDDNSEREQKILEQLSEEMKTSLLLQANRMILEDCQFFQRNFTQDAIQKCVNLIKEKKLTPNEFLINSTEDQSKNGILFFVERGEIDIYQEFSLDPTTQISQNETNFNNQTNNMNFFQNHLDLSQNNTNKFPKTANDEGSHLLTQNNSSQPQNSQSQNIYYKTTDSPIGQKMQYTKHVCTKRKGQYFGEISFFTNFPNKFIAKAKSFSKILYIERDKFIDFMKSNHYQEDYEMFCHIKDNIIQNELQNLFQKCVFCQSYDHTPLICPLVHFQPLNTLLIYKYNFSQEIRDRKFVKRRVVVQRSCFSQLESIYSTIERFLEKNENYIEDNIRLIEYTQTDMSEDYQENSSNMNEEDSENLVYSEAEDKVNISNIQKGKTFYYNENRKEDNDLNTSNEYEVDDNTSLHSPILTHQLPYDKTDSRIKQKRLTQPLIKKDAFQYLGEEQSPLKNKHQTLKQTWKSKIDILAQQSENVIQLQHKSQRQLESQEINLGLNRSSQKRIEQFSRQQMKKVSIIQNCQQNRQLSSRNIQKKGMEQPPSCAPSLTSTKKIGISDQINLNVLKRRSSKLLEKLPLENNQQTISQLPHQNLLKRQRTPRIGLRNFENQKTKDQQQFDQIDELNNRNQKIHPIRDLDQGNIDEKQVKSQRIFQQNYSRFQFFNWDVKFDSLFENMKIFKNYFPNFNHDKIIMKLKKKRIQESNFHKLTSQAKSNLFQKKSISKDSVFQVFKNQVNALRAKQNYSQFSKQENKGNILVTNPSTRISSVPQEIKIDKIEDLMKEEIVENLNNLKDQNLGNKNDNKSTNQLLLKNVKFDYSKSIFSPKSSMISSFQEKIRNSLYVDSSQILDCEDFNLESNRGSITNRIRFHYQTSKKNKTDLSKDSIEKNNDKSILSD